LKIYISPGSVATQLQCVAIFSNAVAYFSQNVSVKTLLKSVNICVVT